MADSETKQSSLISSHRASDSGLQIHLHPLVLLTVSDHITRHTLRQRKEPIVGALLGQHNGRDITLEHAFECQVVPGEQGAILLHQTWFQTRLQQYKDVHKEPALELVGWFTMTPSTGPEIEHVPIHQQIIHHYNETAVLLAFHPTDVLAGPAQGGKLPLTIYESVYEGTPGPSKAVEADGDRSMDVDSSDGPLDLKFRELPYSVETGEAEMISVDFVARGGGNATNVDTPAKQKGKEKVSNDSKGQEAKALNDSSLLSPEDEELITSLTARANAVKMLHTRIQLLKTYLTSLPPSYLSDVSASNGDTNENNSSPSPPKIDHSILRSIQALVNRLPLVIPADGAAFEHESLAEKSDVSLVALLGDLTRGTKNIREMGRKFNVVNTAKQRSKAGRSLGALFDDSSDAQFGEQIMSMDQPYE
ncbi:MAG: hypothetical protein LQ346_007442 [Caloplaca aetnensis]|nr:MAG: hypothetical protein LQ346_007442 [Caloplaca aetnensis]